MPSISSNTSSAPSESAGSQANRYWCDESLAITLEDSAGTRQQLVARPYAVLGSHPRADVCLPENVAPERALLLLACKDGVYYAYLEIDPPEGLPPRGWLAEGEWLPIGDCRISAGRQQVANASPPDVPGLLEKGSAARPFPVVSIQVGGRSLGHRRYRSRLNIIGRRARPDPRYIGAFHSTITGAVLWEDGELWIIDLLSVSGARVDGRVVDAAALSRGSTAQWDDVELKFRRFSTSSPHLLTHSPASLPAPHAPTWDGEQASSPKDLQAALKLLQDERTSLEVQREALNVRARSLDEREEAIREREASARLSRLDARDERRLSRTVVTSYAEPSSVQPAPAVEKPDGGELENRHVLIADRLVKLGDARRRRNWILGGLLLVGLVVLSLGVVFFLQESAILQQLLP